jgi:hypothetical protein
MRRISLRLAVALLAFAVGVASAALWLPTQLRQARQETHTVQAPQATLESAEPFTRVGQMNAMTLDHGCITSETYRAADGSFLSFSHEDYGSPARAAGDLRREIKQAARVVEWSPVKDEVGRQVGERVIVLWRADETRASVLWTREGESFSILADSVERALEFERLYQEKH